ncbi:uncharacterized protein LOC111640480 [Centruroides sculpturatus]|uniref:uncharacterized protein LOC111640480 n=1 Tax=Centruroides sculpturatus TaxID=218467 RepID=UPI000C6D0B2B|nr:uncharacterized protein LOC111640480 [Centruroides sculpturatus]XP_023242257.1 uncharacterized protein LOC111640480 [Centruroides sculpturatus]
MCSLVKNIQSRVEDQKDQLSISWKILFVNMKILGLNIQNKNVSIHSIVVSIIQKIYIIWRFYIIISNFKNNYSEKILLNLSITTLYISTLVIAIDLFIIYKRYLICSMKELFALSNSKQLNVKSIIMLIALIWIHAIVYICYHYFVVLPKNKRIIDVYNVRTFFGIAITENISILLVVIIKMIFVLFITIPHYFCFVLFILICKELETEFVELLRKIEKYTPEDFCREISHMPKEYTKIKSVADNFQEFYSKILLIWTIYSGGNIVCNCSWFFSKLTTLEINYISGIFALNALPFFLFMFVCNAAARVSIAAKKISTVVYTKSVFCNAFVQDCAYKFSMKCLQDTFQFTGWNIFLVDRALVFTIIGIAISYTVIITQYP